MNNPIYSEEHPKNTRKTQDLAGSTRYLCEEEVKVRIQKALYVSV
jgi:hypothetical protein